jgi:hypothetical protein
MEILLKVGNNITVKVSGNTHTEIFDGMSQAQEVFGTGECGACQNKDIRYVVRENDGNKYYELHCTNPKCRARLPFGVSKAKAGELYPKKRFKSLGKTEKKKRASEEAYASENGGFLPNMGWYKYKKGEESVDD